MTERTNDVRLRWLLPPTTIGPLPSPNRCCSIWILTLELSYSILPAAGIPAFYLAEQVGSTGQVVAIDLSRHQIERARAIQGVQLPWPLSFLANRLYRQRLNRHYRPASAKRDM